MKKVACITEKIGCLVDLEKFIGTNIVMTSEGLEKHLIKSNHINMIKYIPHLGELITNPHFIGKNPNQNRESFECVTILEENILVAVKLDKKKEQFFVASIYEITNAKLSRNIQSGRIKSFDNI